MTVVRWGVLGTANIARKQVIPAIMASERNTVVAIASRDQARAQQLAAEFNIPHAFGDYAALLEQAEVDAVYIPVPNSEHGRWTIAAAQAGKHVLCEKPLALSAQEAEAMVAAADQAGVLLAEAFMYRHHPLVGKVRELLRSGVIGELKLIRSTFTFHLSNERNIRLDQSLGGGALMDVGCYGINLARLLTGAEPSDVAALSEVGASGVDESFVGVMRFPDGVLAQFDVSLRAAGGTSYEVIGTAGKIVVRQGFKPAADEDGEIQLHQNGEISRIFTDPVDQYMLMVNDFARAVTNERPFPFPAHDGVANMRVLEALRNAAT